MGLRLHRRREARRQGAAAGAADATSRGRTRISTSRRGRARVDGQQRGVFPRADSRSAQRHRLVPGRSSADDRRSIEHGPASQGETARGCGSCHLPNGRGRPENAPPGGLPAAYFIRQIEDFRHGLRYTADPRKPNTNTMIDLAKAMTDAEVKEAAEYFAVDQRRRRRGSASSSRTMVAEGRATSATSRCRRKRRASEPIAGRIVEMPEDEEQGETLRNPHSGFVAYVPPGSIKKGEDLVTTGGMQIVGGKIVQGKTTACGTCHGLNLTGVVGADVPPIAGRSPSYIVRQLWDIQQGTRNGAAGAADEARRRESHAGRSREHRRVRRVDVRRTRRRPPRQSRRTEATNGTRWNPEPGGTRNAMMIAALSTRRKGRRPTATRFARCRRRRQS